MAIGFDEIDDYYLVTDAAELSFPNSDWCIGAWTYVSDNAGTGFQYLLNTNSTDATNSFRLYLKKATEATNPNDWGFVSADDDGTSVNVESASNPGADSQWRLIIIQRRTADNQVQMYFCLKGGVPSSEATVADTNYDIMNGGDWYIAARSDLSATRFYGSLAAEIFKGNFSLTSAQIQALGGGLPIKTFCKSAGYTLDLYLPMWRADATLLDYSNSGNNAARNGAPTTQAHPKICTPSKRHRIGG